MRQLVFLLCATLASPAWPQDHSGFYLGGDVSVFETEYENLTTTGDGVALGIHVGYRYAIDNTFFIEGEGFAAATNGGFLDFENYYGLTVGVGTYFPTGDNFSNDFREPNFYELVFAGISNINSDEIDFGSRKDNGTILGLGVGYDITPVHSVGLRYSTISVDGDFGDIDTGVLAFWRSGVLAFWRSGVLAIRHSYHF
ncbi:outer membrane beta-barrel protein [uncultured Tateyamaria sp.]|uniref:outer membrane beta-barrel protein n=1 Tax=uncultured Tateyamaria sp. TaxID=455651 RepID=UPI00262A25EF|nr:outer membrane beta-barrel protein [uncultured Tateyamaria sp.]